MSGFWEERTVTGGRSNVLINYTALLGVCEINKMVRLLQALINKKPPQFRRGTTGQGYSGGKQLSVYLDTSYHSARFSVYSYTQFGTTRKGYSAN